MYSPVLHKEASACSVIKGAELNIRQSGHGKSLAQIKLIFAKMIKADYLK